MEEVNIVDREDMALGGEELEDYCQKHGLCNLCAQTRTHKRVFRLKKKNQWQPLTVENKDDGEFIVYKGHCVQPGCFTLEQAKRMLGEIGPSGESGEEASKDDKKKRGLGSRLLSGRNKKKGSDGGLPKSNFDSMAGMSGFSGGGQRPKKKSSSKSKSGRSVTSEIRRDDDDVSVAASAMTSASKVRVSLQQLLKDQAGTVLDVSSTRLHHNHITELVNAFSYANSLQSLILENCRLNDNEMEVIANGLARDDVSAPIKRLSLRSNRVGNRGAVALQTWFQKQSTLEELDVSKNQIGSRGATSTLHAFRDNPNCKIKMLNFAHNEIWDPDDGSFFAANATVELLNMEGNFIHDEGIEAIATGIRANERCKLERLYLGWNGIGDEGCIQLAKMIETNTSLIALGVGENDITSVGARSILSSLASNNTLREITGLYHNQIDRKFIIVAIKQLLLSHVEGGDEEEFGKRMKKNEMQSILEESMSAMDTLAEPLGSRLPVPEEGSESSLDWAEKLYAPGGGVPLGEFDKDMEHNEDCTCETCMKRKNKEKPKQESHPSTPPARTNGQVVQRGMTFAEMPLPKANFDRLTVFQSGPLAYFNRISSVHHSVPLKDFDHETAVLKHALQEAEKLEANIELEVEPGHPDRLRAFFEEGTGRVLQLSGYGHPDYLAFENGAGYVEKLAVEELKNLIENGKCPLQLVVVNSFHSGRIGKAFIEAGVPHVVCCHHTEVFRDIASSHFSKNLFRALASNKSLKQAFYMAQEAVRVEEISKHIDRYVLLPRKPQDDPYHDVPIFFTEPVPPIGIREDYGEEEISIDIIPHLPKHFIGREVDMYEVLEALRVDDVVRVGGPKGSGKASLAAAVCRYIKMRRKTFNYDDVFWLPPGQHVVAEEDTLFGDLCKLSEKMLNGGHNCMDDEEVMEIGERIQIELEASRTLIAIDGRKFKTDASSESLERFIGDLLNSEADVKILLITATGEDYGMEESEGDTINLGPIDFKSSALLFGELSRFITANGCPAAQSPDEFAALMVPPSVAKLQDETKFSSSRRTELMSLIGKGNPLDVIKTGKQMPASTFIELIGMVNTPEVRVDSAKNLEAAVERWTAQRDAAIRQKNYLRADDLDRVLVELEELRPQFPSIVDLQKKEVDLQKKLAKAMANKNYMEGNSIKREILGIKKIIMQEKRSSSAQRELTTANRMMDLQNQMQNIMKLAHSSFSDMENLAPADITSATFSLGSAYHNCEVSIYPGSVVQFDPGNDLGAAICWTNECCDLNLHEAGRVMTEWGGPNLGKDISTLPGITKTRWGLAKCGAGNAVIVGPGNYDDLAVHCVILAVGPLSPACDEVVEAHDEDRLHYTNIMMRSCIRSSLILAKHSQVQSIAFPTLTTKMGGETYEQTLLMGLKIMVEEAKHSDLNTLHIVASTEEESSKLIAMAIDMGLVMT